MRDVHLGDVLERVRRPIVVDPCEKYLEIGVRSHGKGLFHKEPTPGDRLGNKKIFEIRTGDLVFNIVFAWEGAVAVAGAEDEGRCGSHRFPTYRPIADACDVRYLAEFFRTDQGLRILGLASPGSAGRNRTLNQATLLSSEIRLPPIDEQLRIVDLLRVADMTLRDAQKLLSGWPKAEMAVLSTMVRSAEHRMVRVIDVLDGVIGGAWGEPPEGGELDVTALGPTAFAGDPIAVVPSVGTRRSMSVERRQVRCLQVGDIVLERSGGTENQPVGRVIRAEFDMPTVVPSDFMRRLRVNPSDADPSFVFWMLWLAYHSGATLDLQTKSTNIRNLRVAEYLERPIPIPAVAVQREVVRTADALVSRRSALVLEVTYLANLRAALLHDLLSGKHEIPESYDALLESASA